MAQKTVLTTNYDPFDEQLKFHDNYKRYARLVSCGTGAGKTWVGLAEALRFTFEFPGSMGVICEPTYRMLKYILIEQAFPEMTGYRIENFPAVEHFDKTHNIVKWKNGSTWYLIGLDKPESAEGVSVDWCWLDEFRLIGGSGPSAPAKQEIVIKSIIRRLRGSTIGRSLGYPNVFWITTTPDAPKSVLWTNFEDPENRLDDCVIHRWSLDANVRVTESYKSKIKQSHKGGLYQRFVLGLFAAVSIGSFNYDSTIHEFSEYPRRGWFKDVIYGVDWGWTNPACILCIGFDYDGRAFILEEVYGSRMGNEFLISQAHDMTSRWGKGRFFCGADEPKSIAEFNRNGLMSVKAEGKRADGIKAIGERFDVAGDGKPRLYVHSSCVNFISEVVIYDEAKKINDHSIDALRYALQSYSLTNPAWVLR